MSGGRRRDRSHQPSHNVDWPDLIAGYRVSDQRGRDPTSRRGKSRRSQNPTSNRTRDQGKFSLSDKARGGRSNRYPMQTTFNPGLAHNQGYRTSIDLTSQVAGGTLALDGNKRNELYTMLREEVLTHLKQNEVSKQTVLGMKRSLRQKR